MKQREPWHSHVVAQPLLPDYQRYLLDQPDLHSALLTSQRSTACIQHGHAQAYDYRYPAMRVKFMAASPAADAVAVYTSERVTIFNLLDHTVRWHAICELSSMSTAHWSPDGTMLLSPTGWACRLLSSHDGTVLGTCQLDCQTMQHSAWHPQSASLALVYEIGDVGILRPGDQQDSRPSTGLEVPDQQWARHRLRWSPNGLWLIDCTPNALRFYNPSGARLAQVTFDRHAAIGDCAWSSSSELLAVSFLQEGAGILFYSPEAVLMTRMAMDRPCARLAWAGNYLAAQCNSFVWVLSTAESSFGTELCSVLEEVDYFTTPAWHISGHYLALSCADDTIRVVHGSSGKTAWIWRNESGLALQQRFPLHSPTWSASGQELFFYVGHGAFGMMAAFQ